MPEGAGPHMGAGALRHAYGVRLYLRSQYRRRRGAPACVWVLPGWEARCAAERTQRHGVTQRPSGPRSTD